MEETGVAQSSPWQSSRMTIPRLKIWSAWHLVEALTILSILASSKKDSKQRAAMSLPFKALIWQLSFTTTSSSSLRQWLQLDTKGPTAEVHDFGNKRD